MGVNRIASAKGQPRAEATCEECQRKEVIPCGYDRAAQGLNEGQAVKKLQNMGWSYVKHTLRCPTCEAKRKVVSMSEAKEKKKAAEPARTMTPKEKRQIIAMLEDCYDDDAKCYLQGDTDDTVADVLNVMPGWVAEIREDLFGPDGTNENIEELVERLEGLEEDCNAIIQSAAQQHDAATKKLSEVATAKADLDKIKKALGARTLKAAGVN